MSYSELDLKQNFRLPFPIGYKGLPRAQVEAAEVINQKMGISDPVHRKYNVLAWVRNHYQFLGQNYGESYEAIVEEEKRLGEILDEDQNSDN